jgi:DNA-binding winged helix-turn-helix (wHTH) protein/TolB-like protein
MKFCETLWFSPKMVLNYNVSTFPTGNMIEQNEFVVYEFGSFRVDTRQRRLMRDAASVQLTSKAFDTLLVLLAEAGTTVAKSMLMDRVWSATAVEENNLTQQISALRKAFGERAGDHRYIVTIPGRGYCFVMPVKRVAIGTNEQSLSQKSIYRSGKGVLSIFNSEVVFGYGLALIYILAICIPSFFVRAHDEALGIKPRSIAILQFRSSGLGDELLGMGIRDTLRAKLGSIDDITVRPAADIPANDVVDAGKQMHADVVLTGSIQRDNDRVRVAVEMVDVKNERIVWGNTFDNNLSNAFELQDSIATAVLSALKRPRLNSRERSSATPDYVATLFSVHDCSLIANTRHSYPSFA